VFVDDDRKPEYTKHKKHS